MLSLSVISRPGFESPRHVARALRHDEVRVCCGPEFTAHRGRLLLNGKKVYVKGLSWFGFEGDNAIADGLWQHSVDSYLDFMVANQFNALRLPLAVNNVLHNPVPAKSMLSAEPSFMGEDSLWLLERIVMRAAQKGLLVLLDMHRLNSSLWPDPHGLWYNDHVTLETLKGSWTTLAQRFCRHWNVFGADVFNEPHGGTWGTGNHATDWDRAAEVLGNTVLRECARWVVLVEGIGQAGRATPEYFWGENLEGVRRQRLALHLPDKLIYSPHVYGPGLWRFMHYFDDPQFARAMPQVWHTHFGFLLDDPSTTVILGEFGGPFNKPADIEWQRSLVEYLIRHGHVSSFYWCAAPFGLLKAHAAKASIFCARPHGDRCLNPNAGDTGGVLHEDWKTPNKAKIELLRPLHSSNVAELMRGSPPFPSTPYDGARVPHEDGESIFRCRSAGVPGTSVGVPAVQRCNGVPECPDQSDEEGCKFVPCVTVAGPDMHTSCRLPFYYNGRSFRTCTLMDAPTGEPWCPTDLDSSGSYFDYSRSGICGPACPRPPADESVPRGLCAPGSADPQLHGHCAPPPSPPPDPPLPPPTFRLVTNLARRGSTFFILGALACLAALLGGSGLYLLRREHGLQRLAAEWEAFTRKAAMTVEPNKGREGLSPGPLAVATTPKDQSASLDEWWYLDGDDRQIGPLPAETLRSLHVAEVLTSDTLVWSERHTESWQEMGSTAAIVG